MQSSSPSFPPWEAQRKAQLLRLEVRHVTTDAAGWQVFGSYLPQSLQHELPRHVSLHAGPLPRALQGNIKVRATWMSLLGFCFMDLV